MKRTLKASLMLSFSFFTLVGCYKKSDPEPYIYVPPNLDSIRTANIQEIENYFIDMGFSDDQIDTTSLGVRYVILDSGDHSTSPIEDGDSVEIYYTGRLTNNIVFATNVDSVAQTEGLRLDDILKIQFTESGESIQGSFILGFENGITETFKQLGSMGHIIWALPSELGWGVNPIFFEKNGNQFESEPYPVMIWYVRPIVILDED